MLSTFIKLPIVIKIFVLSIFEWPFYTGFTVLLTWDKMYQNIYLKKIAICTSGKDSMKVIIYLSLKNRPFKDGFTVGLLLKDSIFSLKYATYPIT